VLVVNAAFHLYQWLSTLSDSPMLLNAQQMRLLRLNQHDPGFMEAKEEEKKHPNPFSPPLEGSLLLPPAEAHSPTTHSGLNASTLNASAYTNPPSPDDSTLNTSWLFRGPSPPKRRTSPIKDEASLREYLEEYEAWEKMSASLDASQRQQQADITQTSFWRPGAMTPDKSNAGSPIPDYSPVLRRLSYQLSSPLPGSPSDDQRGETGEASGSSAKRQVGRASEDVFYRVGVDPLRLVSWTENLRIWISQTVLVRLVAEIDRTNEQLERLGLRDVASIGQAGLDQVRRAAQLHSAPSALRKILPFMELTANQEYLARRVRELASGGAMGDYRWNAGSQHGRAYWNADEYGGQHRWSHGLNSSASSSMLGGEKMWSESFLPTDAEIVMHW